MSRLCLSEISAERAVDWTRRSLALGGHLSTVVAERLLDLRVAAVVTELGNSTPLLDDNGRGIARDEADEVLERVLRGFASSNDLTLVVEDDLARRGDPGLEGVAFVGDRVLRWADLGTDASMAIQLLRVGASGYPLNAFVCHRISGGTLLRPGRALGVDDVSALAQAVSMVINSVYDAESYVLLAASDLVPAWETCSLGSGG